MADVIRDLMMLARAAGLAIALTTGLASAAAAQTISQPTGPSSTTGTGLGQSFTATTTGVINQIAIRTRGASATTLYLYNSANGSGVNGSSAGSAYNQSVTLTDVGAAGYTVITLATPFPVTAGSTYSMVLDNSTVGFQGSNVYAGGAAIANYATVVTTADWAFQIYEGPAGPQPVPTLSEWALILLGLTLAGSAALYLQRRHLTA